MMKRKSFGVLIGLLLGLTMSTTTLTKHGDGKDSTGLYIGDSLICDDFECYPKVFKASELWEQIKPGQQLPGGLDVRMNLETGVKEAKLHADDSNADSIAPVAIPATDVNEPQTNSHEFSQDFDVIRSLLDSGVESNSEAISTKLDDLMEFAHDYKHGYEIITHEFDLLESISCDEQIPLTVRDWATIMIISCVRNNPRSVEYVNKRYPGFVNEVFQRVDTLATDETRSLSKFKLLKRYLSLLDELTTDSYTFSGFELSTLDRAWNIPDKQIRIEILELISKLFTAASSGGESTNKRLQEGVIPDAAGVAHTWANNIQKLIQDNDIDELHTRKFFNSLYAIKQEFKDVRIETSFLNWLSRQADERKKQLDNNVQERDLEQDSFDKKMIESRHLVFGNPMAHRVKNWNDEL